MKKMTKTLIAVVTILVFALTSSAVFAQDGAGLKSGIEMEKTVPAASQEKVPQKPVDKAPAPAKAVAEGYTVKSTGAVNAKTLNYASTTKPGYVSKGFPAEDYNIFYTYTVGVKTSGKLYIDAIASSANSGSVKVIVAKRGSTEDEILYNSNNYGYLSPGQSDSGIGGLDVTAGNTYYIGFSSYYSGTAKVRAYVYSYKNNRFLKAGKMMLSSGYKGSSTTTALRYKIRPKKTGLMTVKLKEYGYSSTSGDVTILTKNKKTASKKLWYYTGAAGYKAVFGVKKGVTYYLKVTDTYGSPDSCYKYGVKYTVKKTPLKKNTKKRKAIRLKRKGAWKKNILLANNRTGNQWYKFKVTKKRTTRIKVDTTNVKSGTVKLTVYCGKKKIDTVTLSNGVRKPYTITYSTTWGKAKRGTYYVKIHKSKKATGQYRIKYVK